VNFDKDQYISSIFTVPNKDTKEQRMILNLRELNKCLKVAKTGFMRFVNILGADAKPFGKQEY
jgi:hypothetical protein